MAFQGYNQLCLKINTGLIGLPAVRAYDFISKCKIFCRLQCVKCDLFSSFF